MLFRSFIAYVDFVDHGKSEGRSGRSMVIRKVERKSADKRQVEPYSDLQGWQELYSKSVRKK